MVIVLHEDFRGLAVGQFDLEHPVAQLAGRAGRKRQAAQGRDADARDSDGVANAAAAIHLLRIELLHERTLRVRGKGGRVERFATQQVQCAVDGVLRSVHSYDLLDSSRCRS
jgi:hypothetical protein